MLKSISKMLFSCGIAFSCLSFSSCINDPTGGPFQFAVADHDHVISKDDDMMIWGYFRHLNSIHAPENFQLFLGDNCTKGRRMKYDGGVWHFESGGFPYGPMGEKAYNFIFKGISPAYDESFKVVQYPDKNKESRFFMIEVTVPTDVTKQKDIMTTEIELPEWDFNSPCNRSLTLHCSFNSVLSKVSFWGKNLSATEMVEIKNVELCNLHSRGYTGTIADEDRIMLDAAENAFTVLLDSNSVMKGRDLQQISSPEYPLRMLPQNVPAWMSEPSSPLLISSCKEGYSFLKVEYAVQNKQIGDTVSESREVFIPFDVHWLPGKNYEYVISYGGNSGCYDSEGRFLPNVPVNVYPKWKEDIQNDEEDIPEVIIPC